MSQERIAIEFEFRKIVEEEKFVDLHKGRKTQLSQVRKYFFFWQMLACVFMEIKLTNIAISNLRHYSVIFNAMKSKVRWK